MRVLQLGNVGFALALVVVLCLISSKVMMESASIGKYNSIAIIS